MGFRLCTELPEHGTKLADFRAFENCIGTSETNVTRQKTIRRPVTLQGIGLHSGRRVEMTLRPAPVNAGVSFVRIDLAERPKLHIHPQNVHSSRLCTVLGHCDGPRVSTVEHLLSALYGLGVDNLRVELDAEELPILDGSALPFVAAIKEAGLEEQAAGRTFLRVKRSISAVDGERSIRIAPGRSLSIDCRVDFDHPLVSDQARRFVSNNGNFEQEIAPARTFGFLKDVGRLKKAGLAQGGSLDNAVVIDRFSILNPGGLRFPDEFVRHKVLDILGDLALLGCPLLGRVQAHKSGHALHHLLIRKIAERPGCCQRVQLGPDGEAVELPLDAGMPEPGLQSA